ncbi:MAG: dinitrogenase iron-molybdenum cofactor biosynthesis protein [Clostridia bacterium]|nr:dinitrogenase iron-molybdenum cofactor biosynthesis protein [Clostridia bacterium]
MADERYLIAVASSDGIVVNNHFGHASTFYIYEVDNDVIELKEVRKVEPVCQTGEHDDKRLNENAEVFSDCDFLLASKVGDGAAAVLESKGIIPYQIPGIISESIDKLIRFEKVNKLFD